MVKTRTFSIGHSAVLTENSWTWEGGDSQKPQLKPKLARNPRRVDCVGFPHNLHCFFFLSFFYCCSITVVPIFPHCSPLPCLPPFPQSIPTLLSIPWVIDTCSLTRPFPLFPPLSPPPTPVLLSLFLDSMPLVLF